MEKHPQNEQISKAKEAGIRFYSSSEEQEEARLEEAHRAVFIFNAPDEVAATHGWQRNINHLLIDMDLFESAFIDFWKHLNEQGVRYILVGGFATNFHGYQRYTGDVNIWIEDTL